MQRSLILRPLPPALTLLLALLLLAAAGLACSFAPTNGDPNGGVATDNAYWNCSTPSPLPTVTPLPTVCTAGTPDPNGTPGPPDCTKPAPTATPQPTLTPRGLWASPGDRNTQGTFYLGQDVRIGSLKVTLQAYQTRTPVPAVGGQMVHLFTFDTRNEGRSAVDVQWPLQTFLREITQADTTITGTWWSGAQGEAAAGLPHWQPANGSYAPGQHKTVTVAILAPGGTAYALGFTPQPVSDHSRTDLGDTGRILWFRTASDPVPCTGGNTSGPARPGDGGATYGHAVPTPAPALFGYFNGWPVARSGATVLSQAFGCTDYHEIAGYDCPNARPWFHSGIDLANPSRPPVMAVSAARVEFIGVSPGRACSFGEMPNTNLGWMIQLRVLDATGRPGPYHLKYGHLAPRSERVQIGDIVQPGQVLATMASTGCSTGPHLHFMVQDERGTLLDPFNFIGSAPRR